MKLSLDIGAHGKAVAQGLKQAGPPITINTRWDEAGYAFDAAIPIDRVPRLAVQAGSPVQIKQTYGGGVLKVTHLGRYGDMPATYDKLAAYMAAYGHEAAGPSWDEYVSDPGKTPEAELVTNIYAPVR